MSYSLLPSICPRSAHTTPGHVQPNQRARRTEAAQAVARRIGMQLIAEKKAAILREVAAHGDEKSISGKDLADRDLLTLLIKANMSTDIPDSQRLSDEDMLARTSQSSGRDAVLDGGVTGAGQERLRAHGQGAGDGREDEVCEALVQGVDCL